MSVIEFTYDGDVISDVLWSTASFESQLGGIPGTFFVTIKDQNQIYDFVTGKHITLSIDGSLYFGGIVTQVSRKLAFPVDDTVTAGAAGVKTRQWVLRGVDYNIWFDKRVLAYYASPSQGIPDYTGSPNDKAVITKMCTDYLELDDTDIDFTTQVDSIGNPYGSGTTRYVYKMPGTFRDTMKDIVQWTGGLYYFDHSQVLHYHSQETASPGWGFSDTPNHTTTFGFREFEFIEDGTNIVNDALLWGGAAWSTSGVTAEVAFGRYTNATSVAGRGRWQYGAAHFNENGYSTDADLELHAKVIVEGDPGAAGAGLNDTVRGLVNPQKQIRMVWFSGTTPTPLVAGSVVTVALNTFGFSLALPVRNIRISFATPTDARFDGFFGIQTEDPWTLWKYMRQVQSRLASAGPSAPLAFSDGSSSTQTGTQVCMAPNETADGSRQDFTVTDPYMAGSTTVWVNGLNWRSGIEYTELDPTTGTITFYDAPLDGDQIWICYTSAGS